MGHPIVSCAQPQVRASRRYLRRGWRAACVGVALVAAVAGLLGLVALNERALGALGWRRGTAG